MGAFFRIAAQFIARGAASGAAMSRGAVRAGANVVRRGAGAAKSGASYAGRAAQAGAQYAKQAAQAAIPAAQKTTQNIVINAKNAYQTASKSKTYQQAARAARRYFSSRPQTAPQTQQRTPAFGPNSQMTQWQAQQAAMQQHGAPGQQQGPSAPPPVPTAFQKAYDAAIQWGKKTLEAIPVVGKFTVKMIAAGAAVAGLFKAATAYIGGLVESRRELSMFSAKINASMARLDIKRFGLNMQTAQNTAGSTASLTDSYADLIDELQPIRENVATIVNVVGTGIAKGMAAMLYIAKHMPFVGKIDAVIKLLEDPKPDLTPMRKFVEGTLKDAWGDDF